MQEHINQFYTNPMDIVQFLDGEKAHNLMEFIIQKASMFHEETGLSPIVKREKFDIYSVDYYFLVNRLSEIVYDFFVSSNQELADAMKQQILTDFGASSDYKTKNLLINLLDFKCVLFANNDKRWTYTLQRYAGKNNGKRFIISGVTIDGNCIKKLDDGLRNKLERIGDNAQYILELTGTKVFQVTASSGQNDPILSFQ